MRHHNDCPYQESKEVEKKGIAGSDFKIVQNCKLLKLMGGPYSKRCWEKNHEECSLWKSRQVKKKRKR